jgi:RNA recognition motif-containing protein
MNSFAGSGLPARNGQNQKKRARLGLRERGNGRGHDESFCRKFAWSTTTRELKDVLTKYGATDVEIVGDLREGRSRGFGFVDIPQDPLARLAIRELDGAMFQGRALQVQAAKKQIRTDRQAA